MSSSMDSSQVQRVQDGNHATEGTAPGPEVAAHLRQHAAAIAYAGVQAVALWVPGEDAEAGEVREVMRNGFRHLADALAFGLEMEMPGLLYDELEWMGRYLYHHGYSASELLTMTLITLETAIAVVCPPLVGQCVSPILAEARRRVLDTVAGAEG